MPTHGQPFRHIHRYSSALLRSSQAGRPSRQGVTGPLRHRPLMDRRTEPSALRPANVTGKDAGGGHRPCAGWRHHRLDGLDRPWSVASERARRAPTGGGRLRRAPRRSSRRPRGRPPNRHNRAEPADEPRTQHTDPPIAADQPVDGLRTGSTGPNRPMNPAPSTHVNRADQPVNGLRTGTTGPNRPMNPTSTHVNRADQPVNGLRTGTTGPNRPADVYLSGKLGRAGLAGRATGGSRRGLGAGLPAWGSSSRGRAGRRQGSAHRSERPIPSSSTPIRCRACGRVLHLGRSLLDLVGVLALRPLVDDGCALVDDARHLAPTSLERLLCFAEQSHVRLLSVCGRCRSATGQRSMFPARHGDINQARYGSSRRRADRSTAPIIHPAATIGPRRLERIDHSTRCNPRTAPGCTRPNHTTKPHHQGEPSGRTTPASGTSLTTPASPHPASLPHQPA